MMAKKFSKNRLKNAVFGSFFAIVMLISSVGGLFVSQPVVAEPVGQETETVEIVEVVEETRTENGADTETTTQPVEVTEEASTDATIRQAETTEGVVKAENENQEKVEATAENENTEKTLTTDKDAQASCQDMMGGMGWLVCPATGLVSKAVDWLYGMIRQLLAINPINAEDGQPVYEVWKYIRNLTNIVFIIFFLVIIYSQITGYGINNYGIKKALPKLVVTAILMNLSFIICSLLIDVSNVVGMGLRNMFESVEMSVSGAAQVDINMADLYGALAGGIAIAGVSIMFDPGAIFMLIPLLLGGLVSVVSGLITISLRQAVVILLVMIAPLAMVANILPNTESLFVKWKNLLIRMLVFYPMFSLLFGAAHLAGWAIIISAKDGFILLLGVAVQILPLFLSWSLMKMSGTILETANNMVRKGFEKPLTATRVWAESKRANTNANFMKNSTMPSARLMEYMRKRQELRERDTENAMRITQGRINTYVERKISGTNVADTKSKTGVASKYTRTAKQAKTVELENKNAIAHTEHVLSNYGNYYNVEGVDKQLNKQAQTAWLDYGRSQYVKEIDEENDINFLIDNYVKANKRDENNNPLDPLAFQRYIASVGGPAGEERVWGKIISQAARVESKQRAEHHVAYGKIGHNGYNRNEYHSFMVGYMIDSDGWALDKNGDRLADDEGNYIETIPGEAIVKAPEKLVLYDKRDEHGLYFDMKDQDGKIISRVHRGTGADGKNYDDVAFIKETMANFDIPIGDPINNIYNILSGIPLGSIETPQGLNDIGLARYSTTIGGAMKAYKGDASWAGAMFNAGVSNRQIKNATHHAIWVLDSIAKTVRPGALLQQSPASVRYLKTILDPENFDEIFSEEGLEGAINIDNELRGGERWTLDEEGNIVSYEEVENPNYEEKMNKLKRKVIFPAMERILPAFERMRTNETMNNQKQGTADAYYDFLKMVEEKWEGNGDMPFDPTLVKQDLQAAVRNFRSKKHDKDGNLIYQQQIPGNTTSRTRTNLRVVLQDLFAQSVSADDLIDSIALELGRRREYARALERFEELCDLNPNATLEDIEGWFDELCILV